MGELLPLLRLHSDPRLMVIMISADDDFDPGDDDDDDDDDILTPRIRYFSSCCSVTKNPG